MINIRKKPLFLVVLLLITSCSESAEPAATETMVKREHQPTVSDSAVPVELSVFVTPTKPIFPTDYPSVKQTQEIAATHTVEALMNATAAPTVVFETPTSCPTPLSVEALPTPRGTPMGDGFITNEVGRSGPSLNGTFRETSLAWVQQIGEETVIIYPGHLRGDPDRGAVVIVRYGTSHDYPPGGELIDSLSMTGKLEIVDAVGSRLVLRSEQGPIYYFDVEARRFVGSLEAVVPTATRPATVTASVVEWPFDDAPDDYSMVSSGQPFGVDLEFYIEKSTDFDWFAFRTREDATIHFSLTKLPAAYHLSVLRSCDFQVVDFSMQTGTEDKSVLLEDAPPDIYFVLVVGEEGAADPEIPYVLRADILD